MVTLHSASCQLGGTIRNRCSNPVTGFCQYCGRAFCDDHGTHEDQFQEVCSREVCQAKFKDVTAFKPYKQRVLYRNRLGLCGIEDCMGRPWGGCSKCEGVFCELHVARAVEKKKAGRRSWRQPLAVCPTCQARLTLWSQT
jgi:hypothetical protein